MRKPKIQPLIPPILGNVKVLFLLFQTHRIPQRIPCFIPPDVISLRRHEQDNVEAADADQHAVAFAVEGLVVFAVDLRALLVGSRQRKGGA